MQLLIVYAVLVVIGQAAAIGIGRMVENSYPGASLFTFLGLFFVVLLRGMAARPAPDAEMTRTRA